MSASRPPAVLGRRACALLAAGSAVLHGLMVGHVANLAVGVLVVGMALACLYCARELWAAGTPRVWCIVAVMNLSMVAVHWSMPGHHHGPVVTSGAAGSTSTLMVVATVASVLEASVATAVLWVITRRRAISSAPQWN